MLIRLGWDELSCLGYESKMGEAYERHSFWNEMTVRTYGQAGTRTCYLCCFISHIHNPRVGAQRTMAPLDIHSRSRPIGFTFSLCSNVGLGHSLGHLISGEFSRRVQ